MSNLRLPILNEIAKADEPSTLAVGHDRVGDHHEDLMQVGDLAREHHNGTELLQRAAGAVSTVLADNVVLRQNVVKALRDFMEHQRRHMMMEDRDFFPAALKALKSQDWTEIASAVAGLKDPLFSDVAEERFEALRAHILRLEQEAEAERK